MGHVASIICKLLLFSAVSQCYRDIVLALDASYSITDSGFERLKNFAATMAGNLVTSGSLTRVGIVTFSSDATVTLALTPYS